MEKFWLIWCPEGNFPPKYQHSTELSAEQEAMRLAERNHGKEFYVMEAKGRAMKITVQYTKFTEALPDLPF